jgi:hypothetical protein
MGGSGSKSTSVNTGQYDQPLDTYGEIDKIHYPWKNANTNANPYLEGGLGSRIFNYNPGSWDPASGCSKTLEARYTCGTGLQAGQTLSIKTNNFSSNSTASFNCSTFYNECNNFRFEVTNDGRILFTDGAGSIRNSFFGHSDTKQTNESVNAGQSLNLIKQINAMVLNDELPKRMGLRKKYEQYMYPNFTLGAGEYICSSTGNCFFALDSKDGKFKMFTIKLRSVQKPVSVRKPNGTSETISVWEGLNDTGEVASAALYDLNGVSILNPKVANISIDGNRRIFEPNNLELGTEYAKISQIDFGGVETNYDNPGNDLKTVNNEAMELAYCVDQCNANPQCGGFVVDRNEPDKCYLKDRDIFPNANRVKDVTGKELYKRLQRPKGVSKSCMKPQNMQVVAIDNTLFDHYPIDKTHPKVTSRTLCGVDELVEDPTKRLADIENNALITWKNAIGAKISEAIKVMTQYNAIQDDPEMQVNERIDAYDKVNTGIKKIIKTQEIIDGVEEDTHLQVVSETYKYIIWSIVAVIVMIVIVVYGDISNYTSAFGNISNSVSNFFTSSSSSSTSSASSSET